MDDGPVLGVENAPRRAHITPWFGRLSEGAGQVF